MCTRRGLLLHIKRCMLLFIYRARKRRDAFVYQHFSYFSFTRLCSRRAIVRLSLFNLLSAIETKLSVLLVLFTHSDLYVIKTQHTKQVRLHTHTHIRHTATIGGRMCWPCHVTAHSKTQCRQSIDGAIKIERILL